jgi:hypothetical protein
LSEAPILLFSVERSGQKRRLCAFFVFFASLALFAPDTGEPEFLLCVRDWKTGEIYASIPARPGDRLFFGWIHSLEKIPWNEYYHIDERGRLILDAITFPAFGAGIPEDKGKVCYVKDGLIHMEEIDQPFEELLWLNSRTATRDIRLGGELVATGESLPHHVRVRLSAEKTGKKRKTEQKENRTERGESNGTDKSGNAPK